MYAPQETIDEPTKVKRTYDVRGVLRRLKEDQPELDPKETLLSLFFFTDASESETSNRCVLENGDLTLRDTEEAQVSASRFLRAIERGGIERQIMIEVRTIDADPVHASAIDWKGRSIEAEHDGASLKPLASRSTEFLRDLDLEMDSPLEIMTGEGSYRSKPMFAVKVSDQQLKFMLHRALQSERSVSLSAPRVTMFNGQTASMTSKSVSPFVTALRFGEQESNRLEPIVEQVETGWEVNLFVEITEEDQIDLHCELTESEVTSVELASMSFLQHGATVQVPHVAQAATRLSARLEEGEHLMMMSPATYKPNVTPHEPSLARFYILSPSTIRVQSEEYKP